MKGWYVTPARLLCGRGLCRFEKVEEALIQHRKDFAMEVAAAASHGGKHHHHHHHDHDHDHHQNHHPKRYPHSTSAPPTLDELQRLNPFAESGRTCVGTALCNWAGGGAAVGGRYTCTVPVEPR